MNTHTHTHTHTHRADGEAGMQRSVCVCESPVCLCVFVWVKEWQYLHVMSVHLRRWHLCGPPLYPVYGTIHLADKRSAAAQMQEGCHQIGSNYKSIGAVIRVDLQTLLDTPDVTCLRWDEQCILFRCSSTHWKKKPMDLRFTKPHTLFKSWISDSQLTLVGVLGEISPLHLIVGPVLSY